VIKANKRPVLTLEVKISLVESLGRIFLTVSIVLNVEVHVTQQFSQVSTQREMNTCPRKDLYMFITTFIAQKWVRLKCPSIDE
jgi:hypothetical protein